MFGQLRFFSDCACVTSIKTHKKEYFGKNFHATDSDHFVGHEYLPESGESRGLFFFNPSQEIGTIKMTRNTVIVKSWGKAVGSMA